MRLLHVNTLKLTDFSAEYTPEYAILSHCWRNGPNEILYEDVEFLSPYNWRQRKKQAAEKVVKACELAHGLGYRYIWIDTCCIDKRSSSELSEAINSMYLWYSQAATCVAFLDDVSGPHDLRWSRWFTRGWTLQELIAPDNLWFYNKDWYCIGDRFSMAKELSVITRINTVVLRHGHGLDPVHWEDGHWNPTLTGGRCASRRETAREEDMAYCLMGLFDINMPLLYGERENAFRRLQEEIIRRTNDQSILAWLSMPMPGELLGNMGLAIRPAYFFPLDIKKGWWPSDDIDDSVPTPQMSISNEGLEVDLLLFPQGDFGSKTTFFAVLNCTIGDNSLARPAIILEQSSGSNHIFQRLAGPLLTFLPGSPVSPDGPVSNGLLEKTMVSTGKQNVDLAAGKVRRITIQRAMYVDNTHSQNRFLLPPLRIGTILDCDGVEYVAEYSLPGLNKVHRVAPPCKEKYGMVLLRRQGPHHFLARHFRRYDEQYTFSYIQELRGGFATQEDKVVLDFITASREVVAKVKFHNFIGNTFVELSVSVSLSPYEDLI
ncbi:heterokaryon incompatibility protein-domain-containing protein [Xylaria cf. heliscus]|nr:heterokaryon incompatibility protein-domain-containing protein [Xylaria cf. heliscus]